MPKLRDLTGMTYGRLTAVRMLPDRDRNNAVWLCRCECGGEIKARSGPLGAGDVKSCGCLKADSLRKRMTTHGLTKSPTYCSWSHMRARCQNTEHERYADWGGRGITVCEQWEDFNTFLRDMGERPIGTTIDRINNDVGYQPGNCRWATPKQQTENKRKPKSVSKWKGIPTGRPKGVKWSEQERISRMSTA